MVGLLWTQYDYRHTIISPDHIAAVDRKNMRSTAAIGDSFPDRSGQPSNTSPG